MFSDENAHWMLFDDNINQSISSEQKLTGLKIPINSNLMIIRKIPENSFEIEDCYSPGMEMNIRKVLLQSNL